MAAFSTYAEVLTPDHHLMRLYNKRIQTQLPGAVLADVLRQTRGGRETTTPLTAKFRQDIRAAAEVTSDDQLLAIADRPEAPVSLEHLRGLDPQTRLVMICRLDVSPEGTPRCLRLSTAARLTALRSELDRYLRAGRGARIEEHALPDGRLYWRHVGPAGDLPRHLRHDRGEAGR